MSIAPIRRTAVVGLLADHQWEMIQLEEKQNEQLLRISEKLLVLTTEVHALTGELHRVMKQAGPGQAGVV